MQSGSAAHQGTTRAEESKIKSNLIMMISSSFVTIKSEFVTHPIDPSGMSGRPDLSNEVSRLSIIKEDFPVKPGRSEEVS